MEPMPILAVYRYITALKVCFKISLSVNYILLYYHTKYCFSLCSMALTQTVTLNPSVHIIQTLHILSQTHKAFIPM